MWITAKAAVLFLAGRIGEAECRDRINRARVMTGRVPIGRHARSADDG